jgi:hypothetical protein
MNAAIRTAVAVALFALTTSVFAAGGAEPIHAKGTLVDAMCGADIKSQDEADAHTRACALNSHCAASGFGIVVDGKFHKFDAEGNKKAEAIFKATDKKDHIAATVDGTLESDGSITVKSLDEAK